MNALLSLLIFQSNAEVYPRFTITTPTSNITGFCAPNRACSFLGIPYARVPRRFFPSVPVSGSNHDGDMGEDADTAADVDATRAGPMCVQSNFLWTLQEQGTEQCLNLNIWSPKNVLRSGAKVPVFVFIHGGFGFFGSNSQKFWNGDKFAISGRLSPHNTAYKVVVTVNYRLGIFGMFASSRIANMTGATGSANHLGDIILALEWVKRNIATYGGDPDRVTLAGESSGATFTCALLASARAKGLFAFAGVQSGVCMGAGSDVVLHPQEAFARSQWLLDKMGVSEEELHTMPAERIQALSDPLGTDLLRYGPSLGVDGYVLLTRPSTYDILKQTGFNSGARAVFWGYTSLDEPSEPYAPGQGVAPFLATYFGASDAHKILHQYNTTKTAWVQDMFLDGCLRCRTLQAVQTANSVGIPCFAYEYDPFSKMTLHSWDLYAIFDHYPSWDPLFGYVSRLIDPDKIPHRTRMLVQDAWSAFAYHGTPSGFDRSRLNRITEHGLVSIPLERESCPSWIAATNRAGEQATMHMCIDAFDTLSNKLSFWALNVLWAICASILILCGLCLHQLIADKASGGYQRM